MKIYDIEKTRATVLNQPKDSYVSCIFKYDNKKCSLLYVKLNNVTIKELTDTYSLENEKKHDNFFEDKNLYPIEIKSVNNKSSEKISLFYISYNINSQLIQTKFYFAKNNNVVEDRINICENNIMLNKNKLANKVKFLVGNILFHHEISQQIHFELYFSSNYELEDRVSIPGNNIILNNNANELSNYGTLLIFNKSSEIQTKIYYSKNEKSEHEIDIAEIDNMPNNNKNDDFDDKPPDVDMKITFTDQNS